jgi:phosphoribosylformylglycinamidine cyclo-ligase
VNDIAVCGATPLFFLDYYACGKLNSKVAVDVVKGLVRGCKKNGLSLIGGETAEMPGIYSQKDYDLAGTIVGIIEQKKILDKRNVKAGNVLIGLPSNGLHTNGYSLARKVLLKKYRLNQNVKEIGGSIGDELLKVHRSYLKEIKLLTSRIKVNSISHITGGGILGNTKRVVSSGLKINIDWRTWKRPKIFSLIQQTGNIDEKEMRNVFNLGIGLIFIIPKSEVLRTKKLLTKNKIKHYIIGNLTK